MSDENGHVSYAFLAKYTPPPPSEVRIEAWGKVVCIRRLSAGEFMRISNIEENQDQKCTAVAMSLCKPDGSPLFSEPYMLKTDHARNLLAKQDREAFDELWSAFCEVNGLIDPEESAKNSPETESGGSVTNSPLPSVEPATS